MGKGEKTPLGRQADVDDTLLVPNAEPNKTDPFALFFGDSETIADPLYGMIEISPFEKRLIACREMQRLREIRQLGVAHLVYPAAEHSRFTHSLGVCYQAKKLVDKINSNLTRESRYRDWRDCGFYRGSEGAVSPVQSQSLERIERVVISAAALLHDLSHGPFSHDMEPPKSSHFYDRLPEHDEFAANPVFFRYLFDVGSSQVAGVIGAFNQVFWQSGMLRPENAGAWAARVRGKKEAFAYVSDSGYIRIDDTGPIRQGSPRSEYTELPVLGVMLFEIHLFEKESSWLDIRRDAKTKRIKKLYPQATLENIATDWISTSDISQIEQKTPSLQWGPLFGWFKPYRKEIIGNTICADLIDYVGRDGYNTGILSHVDLKFLDRMAITRAVLGDGKAVDLSLNWNEIPDTCEHVVFDLFDHKRGFIRQSIITEILACLHARYLLCERVYQHRVSEGGRAMLQEIARLLCEAKVLSGSVIHDESTTCNCKIVGDASFLTWVSMLSESEQIPSDDRQRILEAKQLAKMLRERRIYREAVIIDGLHGVENPGPMAGAEKCCEALAETLLPQTAQKRRSLSIFMERCTDMLGEYWSKHGRDMREFPFIPLLIGIREFGKRYKVPLVLVAKPFHSADKNAPLEIQPLFVCDDPPHIKKQLDAMSAAYASLWRVYLFLHPGFHKKGNDEIDLHKKLSSAFLNFLRDETKLSWRNSIKVDQLLPDEAIDIQSFLEEKRKESRLPELIPIADELLRLAWSSWFGRGDRVVAVNEDYVKCKEELINHLFNHAEILNRLLDGQKKEEMMTSYKGNLVQLAAEARSKNPEQVAKMIMESLKKTLGSLI
jgi:HD superfamily phosphohydrolase